MVDRSASFSSQICSKIVSSVGTEPSPKLHMMKILFPICSQNSLSTKSNHVLILRAQVFTLIPIIMFRYLILFKDEPFTSLTLQGCLGSVHSVHHGTTCLLPNNYPASMTVSHLFAQIPFIWSHLPESRKVTQWKLIPSDDRIQYASSSSVISGFIICVQMMSIIGSHHNTMQKYTSYRGQIVDLSFMPSHWFTGFWYSSYNIRSIHLRMLNSCLLSLFHGIAHYSE